VPERRESTQIVVVSNDDPGVVHHRRQLRRLASRCGTAVPDLLAGLGIKRNRGKRRDLLLAVEPAVKVGPGGSGTALVEPQQLGVPRYVLVADALLVEPAPCLLGGCVDRVDPDHRGQWSLAGRKKRLAVVDERGVPL